MYLMQITQEMFAWNAVKSRNRRQAIQNKRLFFPKSNHFCVCQKSRYFNIVSTPVSVRLFWEPWLVIKNTQALRVHCECKKKKWRKKCVRSFSGAIDSAIVSFAWVACDQPASAQCALNTQFTIITLNYQLVYFIGLFFTLNKTKPNQTISKWAELPLFYFVSVRLCWTLTSQKTHCIQFVQFVFQIGANI